MSDFDLDRREYSAVATAATPLLAIYLIDCSDSMRYPINPNDPDGKSKIMVVREAFQSILKVMMRRSMKGDVISSRYGIVLLGYSEIIEDLYGGILSIGDALARPLPEFTIRIRTNTTAAFEYAYRILHEKIPYLNGAPAPMVCHITDGLYNDGGNPGQIVQMLRGLRNTDGPVLVENIFVGERLTYTPITDVRQWPGLVNPNDLTSDYLRQLYDMSSPLPASYAEELRKLGYNLQPGVKMLIPADKPELVQLAFAMSGGTR